MNLAVTLSRVFLISSDAFIKNKLTSCLVNHYTLFTYPDTETCFLNIHQRPDVIFIDMKNDTSWGWSFLDKVKTFDPNISVVLIDENNNPSTLDFISKANVFNYFTKTEFNTKNINFVLKNLQQKVRLQNKLEQIEAKLHHKYAKSIVYNCDSMRRVAQLIDKAAATNITCYISGEKGTGKGTAAYSIHYFSIKKTHPFIHSNLSGIAQDDLEKELFGLENTSGQIIQEGKLELAAEGTLYIEDVNLLPISIQAKLLDAIQSRMFKRINGQQSIPLNSRLIVSAQDMLFEEMNAGNFLESLYYRLMGLPISIPPLRERSNDILLLANQFLIKFSENNNFEKKEFSKEAKKKLLAYGFPGNIIELKSTIERAIVLSNNIIITANDIEFVHAPNQLSFLNQDMTFEEYKSKIIHHFLQKYDNDILAVSNKLDIGKSTIYRMLKSEKEKTGRQIPWLNSF